MRRRRRYAMHGLGARVGECEIHVFQSGKRRKVCARPKRKVSAAQKRVLVARLKDSACKKPGALKNKGLKAWCKA
jgi:hypothetical protein